MSEPASRTVDALLRDLCLFDEHTWGSSLSVAQPYSLDTIGQFTEKSILAYRPLARAEWLLAQRIRTKLDGAGPGFLLANPTSAPFSGWVTMPASCLREPFRSLEDTQTGKRHRLYFQRPDTELGVRRFAIALLKLGQEKWALLLRSCFPHDLAAVQRLTLAGWFSGRAVR